jgi:hypothetical protein
VKTPSESPALDGIFPPEECIWQDEAECYVKNGYVAAETTTWYAHSVPDLDGLYAPF